MPICTASKENGRACGNSTKTGKTLCKMHAQTTERGVAEVGFFGFVCDFVLACVLARLRPFLLFCKRRLCVGRPQLFRAFIRAINLAGIYYRLIMYRITGTLQKNHEEVALMRGVLNNSNTTYELYRFYTRQPRMRIKYL